MNATLPDLTAQLEPVHQQALRTVARAAATVGADWFLTGAMARDWVFTLIHGIDTRRATRDADIGIALAGWGEYEQIRTHIIAEGEFEADRSLHRLNHRQLRGFHLDLVPFGLLGGDEAEIAWPPEQDIVMNVIGFEDAFRSALTVIADVDLAVKVASPAGLMLMKLFAWQDRKYLSPAGKDAHDIRLLMTRYEKVAGRSLYDVAGLMESVDFDADLAAARLLGRDVGGIIQSRSREALLPLLDHELAADAGSLLVAQLLGGTSIGNIPVEQDYRKMRTLLASFRAGLDE
jgi:predicted nucleotidyltransferase